MDVREQEEANGEDSNDMDLDDELALNDDNEDDVVDDDDNGSGDEDQATEPPPDNEGDEAGGSGGNQGSGGQREEGYGVNETPAATQAAPNPFKSPGDATKLCS